MNPNAIIMAAMRMVAEQRRAARPAKWRRRAEPGEESVRQTQSTLRQWKQLRVEERHG